MNVNILLRPVFIYFIYSCSAKRYNSNSIGIFLVLFNRRSLFGMEWCESFMMISDEKTYLNHFNLTLCRETDLLFWKNDQSKNLEWVIVNLRVLLHKQQINKWWWPHLHVRFQFGSCSICTNPIKVAFLWGCSVRAMSPATVTGFGSLK